MSRFLPDKIYHFLYYFTFFTLIFNSPLKADINQQIATSVTDSSINLHADHLIRGERLFYGLVYYGGRSVNCAGCHNTRVIDTLNWNPDAFEISHAYLEKTSEDLAAVLLKPTGKKMAEVHANIDLSSQDVIMMKAFMDHFAKVGLQETKPVIDRLSLFLLAILFIIISLADLLIFKRLRTKWVHMILILGSLFWISDTIVKEAKAIGRSEFYEPDQPIKFSHVVHAKDNQTECLYCHSTAEYASVAGIPYVHQCMNCHIIVREGTHSGRYEINKIVSADEKGEPVKWVQVHNLPDHVSFSHAQHVGAAGLDCAECHGEVENMHRVRQVYDLSMGWCLNCHRTTEVDVMNNEFYSNYMQLREDVLSGKIDFATAKETGGTDCMKCHY